MNVVAFAFAAWPACVALASSPSLFGSPGVVALFVQLVQPLLVAETQCLDVVGNDRELSEVVGTQLDEDTEVSCASDE